MVTKEKKAISTENSAKKVKATPVKAVAQETSAKKNNGVAESEPVEKKVALEENKQLFWTLFWIGLVFVAFLGGYWYITSSKSFEHLGMDWRVIKEPDVTFYNTLFRSLDGSNMNYDLYLKQDPRENDVPVSGGKFDTFKYGGYVSLSKDAGACTGDLAVSTVTLNSFISYGIGVRELRIGTLSQEDQTTKMEYATCENQPTRTVVTISMGEEASVKKNEANPYCYEITITSCKDIKPLEKFILQTITDFRREAKPTPSGPISIRTESSQGIL